MSQSIADFRIRSMMCAPLVDSDGRSIGVIQIDTLDQRSRFQQDDLDVLAGVASQAAIAIDNAQLHEAVVRQQQMRARPGAGPQGAAGPAALDAAQVSRAITSSISTRRPTRSAATTTITSTLPGRPHGRRGGRRVGQGRLRGAVMAKLSADVRYLAGQRAGRRPRPCSRSTPASPQRLGRPLRDVGAGGARSRRARADAGQRRTHAAVPAARPTAASRRSARTMSGLAAGCGSTSISL